MSLIRPQFVVTVGESMGITTSPQVAEAVAQSTEDRLRQLVLEAASMMRHCHRTTLLASDIAQAITTQAIPRLNMNSGPRITDATRFVRARADPSLFFPEDAIINLTDLAPGRPLGPPKERPPEPTFAVHWLGIGGEQPRIPQNPTQSTVDIVEASRSQLNGGGSTSSTLSGRTQGASGSDAYGFGDVLDWGKIMSKADEMTESRASTAGATPGASGSRTKGRESNPYIELMLGDAKQPDNSIIFAATSPPTFHFIDVSLCDVLRASQKRRILSMFSSSFGAANFTRRKVLALEGVGVSDFDRSSTSAIYSAETASTSLSSAIHSSSNAASGINASGPVVPQGGSVHSTAVPATSPTSASLGRQAPLPPPSQSASLVATAAAVITSFGEPSLSRKSGILTGPANNRTIASIVSEATDEAIVIGASPHTLSLEHQRLFDYILFVLTTNNPKFQQPILRSLTVDPGLQQLVPYLSQYLFKAMPRCALDGDVASMKSMLAVMHALVIAPHIQIEGVLHQLLPTLLSAVLAPYPQSPSAVVAQQTALSTTHWSIREFASSILAEIAVQFGDDYATLKPRLTRSLVRALLAKEKAPETRYGALQTIRALGVTVAHATLLSSLPALITSAEMAWHDSVHAPITKGQPMESASDLEADERTLDLYSGSKGLVDTRDLIRLRSQRQDALARVFNALIDVSTDIIRKIADDSLSLLETSLNLHTEVVSPPSSPRSTRSQPILAALQTQKQQMQRRAHSTSNVVRPVASQHLAEDEDGFGHDLAITGTSLFAGTSSTSMPAASKQLAVQRRPSSLDAPKKPSTNPIKDALEELGFEVFTRFPHEATVDADVVAATLLQAKLGDRAVTKTSRSWLPLSQLIL